MVDSAFYDTHSNTTSEWYTPLDIYNKLDDEFHFVTDPAAEPTNRLGCKVFFTKQQNGLDYSKWQDSVFINPPYSEKKYPVYKWVKAASEYNKKTGNTVVMLIRATPSVEWFQDFVWNDKTHNWREGVTGRFIRGRIHFVRADGKEYDGSPSFDSMVVIFWPRQQIQQKSQTLSPQPQPQSRQQQQQITLSQFVEGG